MGIASMGSSDPAYAAKSRVARASVVAAVVLSATKLVVGLLTGSLGILAEALHSGLDLAAAIMTYAAVRLASRPPDDEHPYGHAKVESFSALLETALLVLTSAWIIRESVERLLRGPAPVDASPWAFGVMLLSIAVDVGRSRALSAAAKKYSSQALEADALHFSTDIYSSCVVVAGLALVRFGGASPLLRRADAAAALGVALIVLWVSFRLGKSTLDVLLDAAPRGLARVVIDDVRRVPGVLDCRRVRMRHVGAVSFVDLVIDVPRTVPLERAHESASRVEERIHELLPQADVVVHVEPVSAPDEGWIDKVEAIAGRRGLYVHDVRVTEDAASGRRSIDLHLEVDEDLTLSDAHGLADDLERSILGELSNVEVVNTHIEPRIGRALPPGVPSPEGVAAVRECLRGLAASMRELRGVRSVTVFRTEQQRLYVSMQCLFDGALSIGDAHRFSTRIEDRVKESVPDVQHVHVHAEPADASRDPSGSGSPAAEHHGTRSPA